MQMYNGFYTVISPKSGEHRTFQIRTQGEEATFAAGKRIISMLVGPDNESDYQGFGFVTETGINVWGKKRGTPGQPSFWERVAVMLWDLATNGENSSYAKAGVQVQLDKRCIMCNRRLTNPTSIETGIGPECAKRGAG